MKLTAKIASSIEGKCGEAIMSLPYEDSKNLNCPEVITQFNHIARFTHGFIQNGIQSLSALFLIFFIFYYLTTMVDGYFFNPYRDEMQHGIIIFNNLEVGTDPEATFYQGIY